MSGLAAVFHFDWKPLREDRLRAMVNALAHRGPDGSCLWCQGPIGLAHLAMHTTPESTDARQPWSDPSGEVRIVFDGRLDNREEIRELVRARGCEVRGRSDVELVLWAYQAFGSGFAARLLGDFAVVVWDGRTRSLVGARDVAAERPFFYAVIGSSLFIASEIRALVTQPEIPRDANELMVAEHLANRVQSTDETLFRSIRKLPPAHTLIAAPEGVTVRRHWRFDPGHEIRYAREEEYAEHFLHLFQESVRCRLRSASPVAADLSGGLDSSSVAAAIEELRRRESHCSAMVHYLSMVFPGQPCDESHWITLVDARLGIESHSAHARTNGPEDCRRQVRFSFDLPDYPNGWMAEGLRRHARHCGCRVRITGLGGDEWLGGSPRHTTDDLRRLRLLRVVRQVAADASVLETSAIGLLRRSAAPIVPLPLRAALRSLRRPPSLPGWLGSAFRDRQGVLDRLHRPVRTGQYQSAAQGHIAQLLDDGFAIHRAEMEERAAAASGLELREPFNDRRIIEYGLAIPEDQRWHGLYRKVVLRQAMQCHLPVELLRRTDKAEFSSVFVAALRRAEPGVFLEPSCAAVGWVDSGEVARMYSEFMADCERGSPRNRADLWALWKILGVELWFRRLYNGSAEVTGVE